MYSQFSCRFIHIFVVDWRLIEFIVDVDFHHKTFVDCRQNGQKSCDPHLVRTPLTPCPNTPILGGNTPTLGSNTTTLGSNTPTYLQCVSHPLLPHKSYRIPTPGTENRLHEPWGLITWKLILPFIV